MYQQHQMTPDHSSLFRTILLQFTSTFQYSFCTRLLIGLDECCQVLSRPLDESVLRNLQLCKTQAQIGKTYGNERDQLRQGDVGGPVSS